MMRIVIPALFIALALAPAVRADMRKERGMSNGLKEFVVEGTSRNPTGPGTRSDKVRLFAHTASDAYDRARKEHGFVSFSRATEVK